MKLHMLSVWYKGRRITWFEWFPTGVKPYLTESRLLSIGIRQGDCFGVS